MKRILRAIGRAFAARPLERTCLTLLWLMVSYMFLKVALA